MPNQEEGSESAPEMKQPIGSSKRKRKSSVIKHNILSNDRATEVRTSPKPIRTYVKKMRSERGKAGIEKVKSAEEEDYDKKEQVTDSADEIKSETQNESELGDQSKRNQCIKQCQNCSFCSEHSEVKADPGTKMFTCKICAGFNLRRIYSTLEKFKRHTKEVHEPKKDIKRFECTDCPEPVWFPTKSKFCYHLGAKHPGIIKFVCDVCTQTFKLKANYRNHLKSHNIVVQKKFSCDVCGGTFVNRAGYEAHKKRFPGPHIKQKCSHCGFSFSREKHMKNHRCKKLLLEEAAAARESGRNHSEAAVDEIKVKPEQIELPSSDNKNSKEGTSEMVTDSNKKLTVEGDSQSGERDPLSQSAPQSVVVQEYREIDLEGGAYITAEPDQQIILRDANGQIVQGNQILQLDINDFQPGEESQVYLADWNVVAPFVIRGRSP